MVFHRAGDGRGKEHEDKQQRKGKSVGIHLGMRQRDVFFAFRGYATGRFSRIAMGGGFVREKAAIKSLTIAPQFR